MKTVFIVGAGASAEAKMPTGSELMARIIHALSFDFDFGRPIKGDSKILEALTIGHPYPLNMSPFLKAAQLICRGMPQTTSIDGFIDSQGENEHYEQIKLCGKLAIVRTILQAEDSSALFVGPRPNGEFKAFDYLENTWFHEFFKLLTTFKRNELQEKLDSVVFIIFNYDRCIEQYLYHALQNFHGGMSTDEAANLMSKLRIYHPYGTVGSLPWLQPNNVKTNDVTMFGHDPSPKQLLDLTKQIKTFTEEMDESSSDVKAIRSYVAQSDRLVFLGFAFHRLNLELVMPESDLSLRLKPERRLYATAYGISEGASGNWTV